MAASLQGIKNQIGFGTEVTAGTLVVPDFFVPFVSEKLKTTTTQVVARGRRPGQRFTHKSQRVPSAYAYAGPIDLDANVADIYKVLGLVFGGDNSGDPFTAAQTMVHGDLPSFTTQVGRTNILSVPQVHNFGGTRVQDLTMNVAVGEPVGLSLNVKAMNHSIAAPGTLAIATFDDANAEVFTWKSCIATIDGSTAPLTGLTLKYGTGLGADRYYLSGTGQPAEHYETEGRELSYEIPAEYLTNDYFDAFINGDTVDLVVVLENNAGDKSITFTSECYVDDANIETNGTDITTQPLMLTPVEGDAEALEVVVDFT